MWKNLILLPKYRTFAMLLCVLSFVVLVLPELSQANTFKECKKAYFIKKPEAYSICYEVGKTDDARAQKLVGDMLMLGWADKVKRNRKDALAWYKRSAMNGNIEATFNVGVMYEQGLGTDEDFVAAAKWYRTAAKAGHVSAQFNLANMYGKGAGVLQNQEKAFGWYEKAAEQGDSAAMYNVANRYTKGSGVRQNVVEAYKWYTLSAKQGEKSAVEQLKRLQKFMGLDQVRTSERLAEEWHKKRAKAALKDDKG